MRVALPIGGRQTGESRYQRYGGRDDHAARTSNYRTTGKDAEGIAEKNRDLPSPR
jgi:hypothetical protein